MLQIKEHFHVSNQQIIVHLHLVTYKVNIYELSFLRKFPIFPWTEATNEQEDHINLKHCFKI